MRQRCTLVSAALLYNPGTCQTPGTARFAFKLLCTPDMLLCSAVAIFVISSYLSGDVRLVSHLETQWQTCVVFYRSPHTH
jgi:hypothetical protein